MATTPQHYEVLHGLNWTATDGVKRRGEPGDIVDDLLKASIPWLLSDGLIRKTSKKLTPRRKA